MRIGAAIAPMPADLLPRASRAPTVSAQYFPAARTRKRPEGFRASGPVLSGDWAGQRAPAWRRQPFRVGAQNACEGLHIPSTRRPPLPNGISLSNSFNGLGDLPYA